MASLSAEEIAPLQLLLKVRYQYIDDDILSHHSNPFLPLQAQSKAIVVNICRETFLHRNGKGGRTLDSVAHSVQGIALVLIHRIWSIIKQY